MNQKRQPKGTSDGGKFATDANPESTVVLDTEPILAMVVESVPSTKYHCDNCDEVSFEEIHDCGATCREIDPSDAEDMGLNDDDFDVLTVDHVVVGEVRRLSLYDNDHFEGGGAAPDDTQLTPAERTELGMPPLSPTTPSEFDTAIAKHRGGIAEATARYEGMYEDADYDDLIDVKNEIIWSHEEIVKLQEAEIAALRKDREEHPSLDEIITMRAVDRLSDGEDQSADVDPTTLAAEYKQCSQGMQGRDYDGAFEGIDYVVERFIDWREMSEDEKARFDGSQS
jgi:hypothetical protein